MTKVLRKEMFLKSNKKRRLLPKIIIAVIAVLMIGCILYVSDYYAADFAAIEAMQGTDDGVSIEDTENAIYFIPDDIEAGFIFYPGGKVQAEAYVPLMRKCAQEGILCILDKMPFNLAVFKTNAADGEEEKYPGVTNWYIGGHSLGGSMAAKYVSEHTDQYDGLILLAAYSVNDISDSDLKVLSVYGSEDGVLNNENYEKNKENLPDNFTETIIDGGCHAYFGSYGMQDGDNEAKISNEEQIEETAEIIGEFVSD